MNSWYSNANKLRQIADSVESRGVYLSHLERTNQIMRELLQAVWKDGSVTMTVEWQEKLYSELAGPEKWGEVEYRG